ncbi:MFS transporter [Celerinatantimonas sp. YJH-8]|uniref:MFS transporter n=1 Tax=Celerinatantimonas sp. YJH-8 TaxID=3228714 RepID=UPI0038BE3845
MNQLKSTTVVSASTKLKVLLTSWGVVLAFILSNSATPLYVRWQENMNFSSGMLTDVFAAYILGLLFTLLFVGQLSDRYGRKAVLIPGAIAAIISCLLFIYSRNVYELILARLLTGVYVGTISAAGMAAVVDMGGAHYKKQASLIASIAMVFGAAIGPTLAGSISSYCSSPITKVYEIQLILFISLVIVLIKLPLPRIQNKNMNKAMRQKVKYFRLPGLSPEYRKFVGVGIAIFGPGLTSTCFILSLGPSLLAKLLNIESPLVSGLVAGVMFISAIVVQLVLKKLPTRRILLLGALCSTLSMFCLTISIYQLSMVPLVLAALLAGPGQGLGQLGGLTTIAMNIPADHRAESNALMNMWSYIPAGVLPVAAGYLTDMTNLATGASTLTILLLIIAIYGGVYVNKVFPAPHKKLSTKTS